MQHQISPYLHITQELSNRGQLISLKQAADCHDCSESTLRANAKTRRLIAYQAHFGSPILTLPDDVGAFLKSRPDIASHYHPKHSPAVSAAGHLLSPADDKAGEDFPSDNPSSVVENLGIALRSLENALPSERGLMAACLIEIAHAINHTVLAEAGNPHQR